MRGSGQALEFLGFLILAHRLGASDFGQLSVAFLLCRYGGLIGDWGASFRGVRDVAAGSEPAVIASLARRRTVVSSALTAFYVLGALSTGQPWLALVGSALLARGLNRDWLALGSGRVARAGVPAVVQGLSLACTAALARSLPEACAVVSGAYVLGLAMSLTLNPKPSEGMRRGTVPVDGWLLIANLADQVTSSADTLLLASLRSTREAGVYAAIYRIPNAWVNLIGLTALGLLPETSRRLRHGHGDLRAMRRHASRTGFLAGLLVLASIPPSLLIVPSLFGSEYLPGRPALTILLMATAVNAVAAPLHPIYLALGNDRRQASASVVAAMTSFVCNLALVPLFGMVAAASTTLVAEVILLIAYRIGVRSAEGVAACTTKGFEDATGSDHLAAPKGTRAR